MDYEAGFNVFYEGFKKWQLKKGCESIPTKAEVREWEQWKELIIDELDRVREAGTKTHQDS